MIGADGRKRRSGRLFPDIAVKHALDRFVAALLLGVLSPLLAVIACLIKLEDRGSILFRSQRAGLNGAVFDLQKFRTMIPDADRFLDADGRPLRNRVTHIGKHLRRWSLDELPQLLNVLRGEMSLVGPRPVPLEYAERMNPRQTVRFSMRPGLTGLAQVSGRHRLSWSERVALDVEYVENFNLLFDLKILARTLPAVFDPDTLVERGDPRKVDLG